MNIIKFIKPLVIGKPGINDNEWHSRISIAKIKKNKKNKTRIEFKNHYEITTVTGLKKRNLFKVILFIDECGQVNFNRITIVTGEVSQNTKLKKQMKSELYKIFCNLKELNTN